MPSSNSLSTICSERPGGHLLAGFQRAADADMAAMALADRGHDRASLYCFTDRELLRNLEADQGPQPSGYVSSTRSTHDCHWLLMAVDAEDLALAAEYMTACGARQAVYCRFCCNEMLGRARIDILLSLGGSFVVDEPALHAESIAEFHPVSWQAWTRARQGSAGAE